MAYQMTAQAGAKYARVFVPWSSIAPATLPASWNPSDPTSPYYDWSSLNASVTAAHNAGVTPILNILYAPSWAYHVQPTDTWHGGQPDVAALGAFATALARHFDGHHSVPAEHVFSVWNEPNFNRNLFPQSPLYYRAMVNAVADSAHAVDPNDLVLAGELAPFKHAPSSTDKNSVIPPLTFMHTMLCISSTTPAHLTCAKGSAHFDVWTHHPYSDTGPFGHAKVSGGVELGDLPKMNSLLQTAKNLGAIASAKPVQFWVTEIGWSSKPPNTNGVPMKLETRWVAESLYQTWKSGATLATWFLLQDEPLHTTPFQSGLYTISSSLANASPKPYLMSFRFPFVAYLKSGGKVKLWGRDMTSDKQDVTIQVRHGTSGAWKNAASIMSNSNGIFLATMPLQAKSTYWVRASAPGSGNSAAFSLTVPSNENMNVSPFPLS